MEEQFYILYPLALACRAEVRKRFTPAIVLAAALASFALNIASSKPSRKRLLPDAHPRVGVAAGAC